MHEAPGGGCALKYRVVVTGIGVITPLGIGKDAFWRAIEAGRCGVNTITRFEVEGYPSRIAAQVDDFDPADFMPAKRQRWTDRFAQFSVAAARMAIDDAGFHANGYRDETGVYIGSALGGLAYADEQHDVFRNKGLAAVRPLLAISAFGGSSSCNIAMEFDLRGPNIANANACASGAVAIGQAFRAIASGEVRAALAGGVEAPLAPLVFGAFTVIRAMSTNNADPAHACRPFDLHRDGFVMAEGAGLLLLERFEDALKRDASIYGEIAGFGLTNDAYHMTAPRPDGVPNARSMIAALREAGVAPEEIDYVNAHGSSTPLGDKYEIVALRHALGAAADTVPVSATKGQHGHALGASGAWEAAISLLAMQHRRIPKTSNLATDDPDCNVHLTKAAVDRAPRVVLSNSAGFGGINAALVMRSLQ